MRISSLLHTPINSMISNLSSRIGMAPSPGFIKIAKSNSELEVDEQQIPCNRLNLVKNLPKIEQISSPLKKSSTIEIQKNKYMSLRRKKAAGELKEQKIK